MDLNSLLFILLYLPIFIGLMYFIKNNNIRNILILIFSCLFYLLNDFKYFLLLLLVILFSYLIAKKVKNNKPLYIFYLIILVLVLAFFKYFNGISSLINLSFEKIIMPIGISFYIFTSIAYVSDVYYGKIDYEDKFINVLMFLTFFPTVTSGPILRYKSFRDYIDNKEITIDSISDGLRRFIIGLFKKVIIANQIAVAVNICFNETTSLSTPLAWFGSICFMLQLYYDFSGYSDMAIGLANMIGFSIDENFNDPYTSLSIKDFWHRWHISLSSWFRDYVYIPLGGNRVSNVRWVFNIFVVWSLTGIWHGSTFNYLLWGIWNGIFLLLNSKVTSKWNIPDFVRWILTQLIVMYGFTIFHTNSLSHLKTYTLALLFKGSAFTMTSIKQLDIFYLWFYIIVAILFCIPNIKKIFYSLNKKCPIVYDLILVCLLVLSIVFIVSGSYSAFIYAGF